MVSIKKSLFIFLCITACSIQTAEQKVDQHNEPALIISIPKCGTHLLSKCIHLLTGNMPQSDHFKYNTINVEYVNRTPLKHFFIYRDPRDQVVSFAFYSKTLYYIFQNFFDQVHNNPLPHIQAYNERYNHDQFVLVPIDVALYIHLPFDRVLSDLIVNGTAIYDRIGTNTVSTETIAHGIHEFYLSYMSWMSTPGVCTVRFEDLIGPLGGGSLQAQQTCIIKIAQHLGLSLSQERLNYVIDNLFGNTATFREGQIGSWKKHFNKKHKRQFKDVAGQLLIDLGYEQNFNW